MKPARRKRGKIRPSEEQFGFRLYHRSEQEQGRWRERVHTTELANKHVERLPDRLLVRYVVARISVVASLDALHICYLLFVYYFVVSLCRVRDRDG